MLVTSSCRLPFCCRPNRQLLADKPEAFPNYACTFHTFLSFSPDMFPPLLSLNALFINLTYLRGCLNFYARRKKLHRYVTDNYAGVIEHLLCAQHYSHLPIQVFTCTYWIPPTTLVRELLGPFLRLVGGT